jgi:hypothetical protein
LKSQVPSALADPMLEVRDSNGVLLDSNDNWQTSGGASDISHAGLAPTNAAEAAVYLPLVRPGEYTAILRGKNRSTGVGLVELYDLP